MTASAGCALGTCAFGRAIDAHGRPLDRGPILRGRTVPAELRHPLPRERAPIHLPFWTGIRVIDAMLTIGRGARVGIFGAPGTGKTTLLESIVGGCVADAVVVALVGERGREAQTWIERCNSRTTLVCATSDRPALERLRAAHLAFAHAGALRERGLDVVLVLDSLARVAGALREIGIAAGEGAGRGGFPPSVFAEMARLIEVAGALHRGSITLIATVLHDGDERDPVSDAARSLLDGHITLSTRLAQAGAFPAIDVPASASRTMDAVAGDAHRRDAATVRHALATLERIADARSLGIDPAGPAERAAIAGEPALQAFLRQDRRLCESAETLRHLTQIARVLNSETSR